MTAKNILYNTRCYLIGHMEHLNGRGWRSHVKQKLSTQNIIFFDPYSKPFIRNISEAESSREQMINWREAGKYHLIAKRMKQVRSDDLRLCDLSDWFIAVINPKVASWGSAEEITTLVKEKKPVFLVIDDPAGKKACPLWLFGVLPHTYIYNNIDEVISVVEAIDAGAITLDKDRWRLIRKELR